MSKQNHEVKVKLTKEQHDKIKRNAEKSGLTIQKYILYVGLNTSIEIKMKVRE